MKNEYDSNYVSVGGWMAMMLITAIPVIGWIMILVWAFYGTNEARKNYFRAILAWIVVLIGLGVAVAMLGSFPALQKQIQTWTHKG